MAKGGLVSDSTIVNLLTDELGRFGSDKVLSSFSKLHSLLFDHSCVVFFVFHFHYRLELVVGWFSSHHWSSNCTRSLDNRPSSRSLGGVVHRR